LADFVADVGVVGMEFGQDVGVSINVEFFFPIADGRKIDFPEIEIQVEESNAVGVAARLFANLADDADVGLLVFVGPAGDELLFGGKLMAGKNAGAVKVRRTVIGRSENMRPSKSEPIRDGDFFGDAGIAAHDLWW